MSQHSGNEDEQDHQKRLQDLTFIEIGERLFHWREYICIPIFAVLLLAGAPTSRTATIGTLLLLVGFLFRLYSLSFMSEATTRVDGQTDRVIDEGPFGIIRNPIYAANSIMIIGIVFYSGRIFLGIFILSYFAFQYHCISKYEDALMTAKFGDDYLQYTDRVPAWLPEKIPALEDWSAPPLFVATIRREKKSFFALAIVLFLLMLSGR